MTILTLRQHLQRAGLVLASGNRHKFEEFARILAPRGIAIQSAADSGLELEVDETADSFRGNAELKAREYFRRLGRPVIADDSGLVVDALSGGPGIYSARYGGPGLDDAGRRRHLLHELRDVPEGARTARFVCVLAVCVALEPGSDLIDGRDLFYYEGTAEGWIGLDERGDGGFGYDPVFRDPATGRSFAELSAAEKDARSHRGQALRRFVEALDTV